MPYIKETFDVRTIAQAKNVVLSDDANNPNKFEIETSFLVQKIKDFGVITSESKVLDFGCGMGRVSKGLVEEFKCNVIGVDISESMLKFAMLYVSNPSKFKPTLTLNENESIDCALSIFCLQHTENPKKEVEVIYNSVKANGFFILLNEKQRFVPEAVDANGYVIWNDDCVDIENLVSSKFSEVKRIQYLSGKIDIILYQKVV